VPTTPSTYTPRYDTFGRLLNPITPPPGKRNCKQYHPGAVFDRLTLVKRFLVHKPLYPGFSHGVTKGFWLARCKCGTEDNKVHTRDLRHKTYSGRMCKACIKEAKQYAMANGLVPPRNYPAYRKQRDLGFPSRLPVDRTGQVYGRLTCMEYVPRQGWSCLCATCGGREIVKRSAALAMTGKRKCRGECVKFPISA
jgi:hypothetical protein